MRDGHDRRKRDQRKDQIGRTSRQRIEQHHLAAGAGQPDDQAVDHRAQIAIEPPAGARQRIERRQDHRDRPDAIDQRLGKSALRGDARECAPHAPQDRGREGIDAATPSAASASCGAAPGTVTSPSSGVASSRRKRSNETDSPIGRRRCGADRRAGPVVGDRVAPLAEPAQLDRTVPAIGVERVIAAGRPW